MVIEYFTAFGSVVASAKSAVDLAKSVKDLATADKSPTLVSQSSDLHDKVINLNKLILDLQDSVASLQAENAALKKQVIEHEDLQHDFEKYCLKELVTGVLVYGLKATVASAEPVHYLCAHCFTQSKKSILQLKREAISGDIYRCHTCGSEICDHSKKQDPSPVIVPVRRSSIDWKGY